MPDGMYMPSAVRVDADGGVYVADTYNDRVLVFEPPSSLRDAGDKNVRVSLR